MSDLDRVGVALTLALVFLLVRVAVRQAAGDRAAVPDRDLRASIRAAAPLGCLVVAVLATFGPRLLGLLA